MSCKTRRILFFLAITIFAFANTSQARYLLVEIVGEPKIDDNSPRVLPVNFTTNIPETLPTTTTRTATTTRTTNPDSSDLEYKFLHQGHCTGSPNPYVSPHTNQKTIKDCANECASRIGVKYFAYKPEGNCACYARECKYDGKYLDHKAYEIQGLSGTNLDDKQTSYKKPPRTKRPNSSRGINDGQTGADAIQLTPEQCCKNNGVPGMCLGFCMGTNSYLSSLEGKSKKKFKKRKSKGFCTTEYERIIENCWNPTVDEENEGTDVITMNGPGVNVRSRNFDSDP